MNKNYEKRNFRVHPTIRLDFRNWLVGAQLTVYNMSLGIISSSIGRHEFHCFNF